MGKKIDNSKFFKQKSKEERIEETKTKVSNQQKQDIIVEQYNRQENYKKINNLNTNKKYNNQNNCNINNYDIISLTKIEENYPQFKEELFSYIDLINFYFNSVIRPFLLTKNNKDKEQQRLKDFKTTVEEIEKDEIYNNQEIYEKNKYKFIKLKTVETQTNFDYLSRYFVKIFEKFLSKNNYLKDFRRETMENFLIFYKIDIIKNNPINNYKLKEKINNFFKNNNIVVIQSIKSIINKRHWLEHPDEANKIKDNSLNFLLSMMLYLPTDEMEKLLSKISSYIEKLKSNKKYNQIQNEDIKIQTFYNYYKKQYKKKIESFYSNYLAKSQPKYNNKQEQKIKRCEKQRRKHILQGVSKYKNKTTGEEIELIDMWRQYFNRYQTNYNTTFNIKHKKINISNGNFFKLPTFKRIFNFYSKANIDKIEEYFYKIVKEQLTHYNNIKKYDFLNLEQQDFRQNLIKFDYIREFYNFSIDVNLLIRKYLYEILQYEGKEEFEKNERDKELKTLRNNLKHNHLFFYKDRKNFVDLSKDIFKPIFHRLQEIEEEIQTNIKNEIKNLKQAIINNNKNLDKQQLNQKIKETTDKNIKGIQKQYSKYIYSLSI